MLGLVLLFIPFIQAQVRLDPIEVMAPGPLLQQVSTPIWRASEARLQEAPGLQEVLQQAPGVQGAQTGGFGGQGSLFLRGSESRHTLILTDGMRLNDPSSTERGADTAFILTPFFEDLLLLQGPAPVLYGGDATSGVVELVPRRGGERRQTLMGLSYGSFQTRRAHGIMDWGGPQHSGTFGLVHAKTQGFSRLSKRRYGATEEDGAESNQLMQASRHRWTSAIVTDLLVYGVVGQAQTDDTSVGDSQDHTNNRQSTVVQTTRGQFHRGEWWVKTGLVGQRRDLTSSSGDLRYRGQTRDARGGVRWRSGSWETLAGLGGEQEWISTNDFSASNDLGHLFLMERWYRGSWLVELGGRGEHHQRYGDFFAHEASISQRPTDTLKWYLKHARGYKSPSLYQLYAPGSFGGNLDLAPEFNTASEIGGTWSGPGEAGVVFFQQDFSQFIQYQSTPALYLNGGSLRVRGVETSVLSPEHSWGQMRMNWSWLDYSHYQRKPLRRAPYIGSITWMATWGRWGSELSARFVGGRTDFDAHTMAAYEVLSGSLSFTPDTHQQWTLQVGNLTDRDYEEAWGYTTAPLNLSLQWLGRY